MTLFLLPSGNLATDIESFNLDEFRTTMKEEYPDGHPAINALQFLQQQFEYVETELEKHLRSV